MIAWSILLILLPVGAYYWAREAAPKFKYMVTLLVFGAIVAPFSLGLYATYFLGPLGIATGMVGLISSMFHGAPGYHISLSLGLLPAGEVIKGASSIGVAIVNGFFWAAVYGAIGFGLDKIRYRNNVL